MTRILVVLCALVFVSGCSTVPFKEGKKIEKVSGFLGATVYKQDGRLVDRGQMRDALASHAESRDAIDRMERWRTGAYITGGAAIGLALSSVLVVDPKEDRGTSNALLFSAIGLVVLENFFFIKGDHAFEEAVDDYNGAIRVSFDGKSIQSTYDLVRF